MNQEMSESPQDTQPSDSCLQEQPSNGRKGRPKKSVAELKASGTWQTMSKAEQLERLLAEGLPQPQDLSPEEVTAWTAATEKLTRLGVNLTVEDENAVRGLVKSTVAGDEEAYSAIFSTFFGRMSTPPEKLPPPPALETAKTYASDIVADRIAAGKFVRLAAKRFLDDLNRTDIRFDEEAAQRVVDYITHLGLDLLPFQVFILANIFGFKLPSGLRRFRYAFVLIAKKNGKTALSAALSLYMTDPNGDGEKYSNSYVAATTRYQSQSLCFKAASRLRNENQHINEASRQFAGRIEFADGSVFEPLAANSEKLNGLNIHFGVLDELGDHPTSDLHNVFTSATTGRKQPLILSITTAGENREQIAFEQRQRAAQILEGVLPGDSMFAYIAELDEGDSPEDEGVWIKANPGLGVLVPVENVRDLAQQAAAIPSTKRAFLRYSFNIWPTTSLQSWIDVDDLNAPGCAYVDAADKNLSAGERIKKAESVLQKEGQRDLSKLSDQELMKLAKEDRRRQCFAGLDLALVNDLSALCLLFPPKAADGGWELLFRIWCPEENIIRRSKEQRVPYDAWARSGFISTTPGEVTDFACIKRDIVKLRNQYQITELGFDRTMAIDLAKSLEDSGMKVLQVPQGFQLAGAINRISQLVVSHKFCTFGHPVANWCFSNVSLAFGFKGESDCKIERRKSREKVDAAVAAAIAMYVALGQTNPVTAVGQENLDRFKVGLIRF